MKKGNVGRKFNRRKDQRKALLRSLARNLITNQKITTTEAKAKELRPFLEKLITRARTEGLSTVRYLKAYFDDKTIWKLTKEIAPRYNKRPGGYTRITKVTPRGRQAIKSAVIEFIK